MTQVIWVDSRMRISGGTDSDFEVSLRESVHLSDTRVRVDNLTFVNSFLTTDAGRHLYFMAEGGFMAVSVPEAAYTGSSLSRAIETATGRTTTYDPMTNSITHHLASPSQRWLSDAELAAESGSFPPGATRGDPRSLNVVLGDGTHSGSTAVRSFVRMAPWSCMCFWSSRLRCENHHGPRGSHDIICSVPLVGGIGTLVEASSPMGVYPAHFRMII